MRPRVNLTPEMLETIIAWDEQRCALGTYKQTMYRAARDWKRKKREIGTVKVLAYRLGVGVPYLRKLLHDIERTHPRQQPIKSSPSVSCHPS